MRQVAKTVSNKPVEFIPEGHKEYDKNAQNMADRPLIYLVRKLTREDRLNINSIAKTVVKEENGENTTSIANIGDVLKYVYENCVLEIKNVLLQEDDEVKELESVKGSAKNRLWDVAELEAEHLEAVVYVQQISSLSDAEAKNSN